MLNESMLLYQNSSLVTVAGILYMYEICTAHTLKVSTCTQIGTYTSPPSLKTSKTIYFRCGSVLGRAGEKLQWWSHQEEKQHSSPWNQLCSLLQLKKL